ncbi:MAG TPA: hypothetical protein VFM08_05890 [Nocardioides sp.]|jgi:hypothetical protein|nr:hypothetical protein [Nocardioides sp.]
MTTTCDMSIELGAYVLHALEHDEDEVVRRHVAGCDLCQDEVQELSFTVSLLSFLTLEDLEQLEADEKAYRSARQRSKDAGRPRRARRRVVIGLVAATFAGALAFPIARVFDHPEAPSSAQVLRATDPNTRVTAAVSLARRESGTRVTLDLSGAYPSGWCALVARSRDGHTDTAATWRADASGAAHVAGMTAISTNRLRELDVVTGSGRLLVRIPVHQDS